MNYLLDTCLVSELIKKKPEPRVVEWVRQHPEERLYLSVLTLGELEKGIAKEWWQDHGDGEPGLRRVVRVLGRT